MFCCATGEMKDKGFVQMSYLGPNYYKKAYILGVSPSSWQTIKG